MLEVLEGIVEDDERPVFDRLEVVGDFRLQYHQGGIRAGGVCLEGFGIGG